MVSWSTSLGAAVTPQIPMGNLALDPDKSPLLALSSPRRRQGALGFLFSIKYFFRAGARCRFCKGWLSWSLWVFSLVLGEDELPSLSQLGGSLEKPGLPIPDLALHCRIITTNDSLWTAIHGKPLASPLPSHSPPGLSCSLTLLVMGYALR